MATIDGDSVDADVYATLGCNLCPEQEWEAMDFTAIGAEYGATFAFENGPRYWVLDSIDGSSNPTGQACADTIGGIPMTLVASVRTSISGGQEVPEYNISVVDRNTVFHYNQGREVYQLQSNSGDCYIMQSFTTMENNTLATENLSNLGTQLNLPSGWSFSSHTLDEKLQLSTVNRQATVVTDDLSNTYQWLNEGCLD